MSLTFELFGSTSGTQNYDQNKSLINCIVTDQ